MAKVYYDLIHKGLREIDQVPPEWKEQVQALLESNK
ncbi:CD1375 family protein [Peribacillus castrilensis]